MQSLLFEVESSLRQQDFSSRSSGSLIHIQDSDIVNTFKAQQLHGAH